MGRTGYIRNAWRPIGGYLRSAPTHLYSINWYQSRKMFLESGKSAERRVILKCLCINKTCENGCQVAPGMWKTRTGVQVDGYHRRQEAYLWKLQLWLGLGLAQVMNLSFNNTLKKAPWFLYFAVSLPVSTWQETKTALPRKKAWTWATFLLSTHPLLLLLCLSETWCLLNHD